MARNPRKFKRLLTKAIFQIKSLDPENTTMEWIQHQLGIALGRSGGSAIVYWRAGHIPEKPSDVEILAREIIRRSDLGRDWLIEFIHSSGYTYLTKLCDELFPMQNTTESLSASIVGHVPGRTYGSLVGRDHQVSEVLSVLLDSDGQWIATIDGMGGIGKSAIALEVAHRCKEEAYFDRVIWISAARGITAHPLTFEEILNTVCSSLDAFEVASLPLAEKTVRVHTLLRSQRTLLAIDNLDTAGEPQDQILFQLSPLLDHSKGLLTSRYRFVGDVYPLHLTGLDSIGGKNLIRQESARKNITYFEATKEEALEKITEATGGSPLAIKLVVGQLTRLSLDRVLDHLREVRPVRDNTDEDEYIRLYKKIFFPSWQLLSDNSQKLLLVMARFPPEVGGRLAIINEIAHMEDDELDSGIDELWMLSFLEVKESSDIEHIRYYMHTLTQYFVRSDIVGLPETINVAKTSPSGSSQSANTQLPNSTGS